MARIDARDAEAGKLVRSQAAKHRHVAAQVVTSTVVAVSYVVTAVLVPWRRATCSTAPWAPHRYVPAAHHRDLTRAR